MLRAIARTLSPDRPCCRPLAVAAGLLVAAWVMREAGLRHAESLDLSRFEPSPDIYGALRRDGYVATEVLAYHRAAAVVGWSAVTAVGLSIFRGRLRILGWAFAVVCLGAAWWFTLAWLVCSVFAT
jgi:hypothetical protein